jgi:hypothetical protein
LCPVVDQQPAAEVWLLTAQHADRPSPWLMA